MDNIQKAFEAKNRLRNPRENLQNFARGRQARDEMTGRTRTAPGPTPVAAQPPAVVPTAAPAPTSMLRTAGRAVGPIAGVGLAVPPVLDVANDPNSSLLDVGTEIASQTGRLASAGLGAKVGATAGIPLGPIGAAVGGVGGGIAGYLAGGKVIEGVRDLAGVDPRDPSQRIRDTNAGVDTARDAAMDGAMAGGFVPDPALVTANDPAIGPEQVPVTLDGSTGQPITAEQDPLGYRRSRLAELGVPENVQDGPVTSLDSPGTGEFQNVGDFGGNAPIYGRSTEPGGRVNDFVGVGDMARPGDAPAGEDPLMTRLRSQMRVEDTNATTEVMRQNRLREMGRADRGDSEFYINREADQAAAREGLRGNRSSRGSNEPELSPSEQTMALLAAQNEQTATGIEARAKIAEAETKAAEALAKQQESGRKAANQSSEDAVQSMEGAIDVFAQGDDAKKAQMTKFYSTIPVDIRQAVESLPATDRQAMMTNIFDVYEAQNEGMVAGRDVGATATNASVLALLASRFPKLFGAVGAAGDTALTAASRGRYRGNALRTLAAPAIGAATGVAVTPSVDQEGTDRFDPLILDPVTGEPMRQGFSLPNAATIGPVDALRGSFRTEGGRIVDPEVYNDDRTQAARELSRLRRQFNAR